MRAVVRGQLAGLVSLLPCGFWASAGGQAWQQVYLLNHLAGASTLSFASTISSIFALITIPFVLLCF